MKSDAQFIKEIEDKSERSLKSQSHERITDGVHKGQTRFHNLNHRWTTKTPTDFGASTTTAKKNCLCKLVHKRLVCMSGLRVCIFMIDPPLFRIPRHRRSRYLS